jgi:hypothetical protein
MLNYTNHTNINNDNVHNNYVLYIIFSCGIVFGIVVYGIKIYYKNIQNEQVIPLNERIILHMLNT